MNDTTSVREVMTREYVGVSESDALVETARLLRDQRIDGAVVLQGDDPVGTVSLGDVIDGLLEEEEAAAKTAADAMDTTVPRIDSTDTVAAAAGQLLSNAVSLVVVVDESGGVTGVVTRDDLIRSAALDRESPADNSFEPARTEDTTDADASYSNQGICEGCGALTSDLVSFNGQLLCSDCRDV